MTNTTAPYTKFRFSVRDYYLLSEVGIIGENDRVELLDGEIVPMSPINSPHAACVDFLNEWLVIYFQGKVIVRVQNPVRLSEYSEPEPDIAVVELQKNRYRDGHPGPEDILLLIEVADSSLKKDKELKLPIYAQAKVPEVWIINLVDQELERYTKPTENKYEQKEIFHKGEQINTSLIQKLSINPIF